jgi:hypothetical protein
MLVQLDYDAVYAHSTSLSVRQLARAQPFITTLGDNNALRYMAMQLVQEQLCTEPDRA